jgi:type II secretory pathway component PulC|tara:strand:- start:4702 stop:5094 length:393 start_codon:yes stop_codon:yes gene_type:complete
MNTKQVKKLINTFIALLLLAMLGMLSLSFINKPNIQDIRFTNLDKIKNNRIDNSNQEIKVTDNADFNYIVIGYRVGDSNSSVIVKKGSKEFVLYEGDILENTYELTSISQDEIIFKGSGKLYKLENKVGK